MIRVPIGPKRAALSVALGCMLAAPPLLAAPGDPLGGDDTGCAPTTTLGLNCAKKALSTLVKLRRSVLVCHLAQAGAAFGAGTGSPEISSAEEDCENAAKATFDDRIASLVAHGCDATVTANASARGDILVGDQSVAGSMDALNAAFFCDPTSGNLIDPGGDDGGYIPATTDNYKCSVAVAKLWSARIDVPLYRCHTKLASAVLKDKVYDEEACEDTGPKSALGRYDTYVNKYVSAGICPPCLADAPGALGIGTDAVADADANLQELYICPAP